MRSIDTSNLILLKETFFQNLLLFLEEELKELKIWKIADQTRKEDQVAHWRLLKLYNLRLHYYKIKIFFNFILKRKDLKA
jgi:hypothetical protein